MNDSFPNFLTENSTGYKHEDRYQTSCEDGIVLCMCHAVCPSTVAEENIQFTTLHVF